MDDELMEKIKKGEELEKIEPHSNELQIDNENTGMGYDIFTLNDKKFKKTEE